jgi:phytoene dehydrogenase-like protein
LIRIKVEPSSSVIILLVGRLVSEGNEPMVEKLNSTRKAAIIGAGIAGLCAAVYARKSGYDVELIEQHETPGGLATSWRRGDYTFETCLHWLLGSGLESPLHAHWCEVFDIDRLSFIYPEEFERVESEHGGALSVYSDLGRMESEFLKRAPQDEAEIRRFAAAIRRLGAFPLFDLTEPWPNKGLALIRALPYLASLRQWSRMSAEDYGRRFRHELLRRFFGEGDLAQLSTLGLVLSLAWRSNKEAGYPIGGSQAVIKPIAENFRALGGRLRLGAKVEKILTEQDAAVGVKLASGETIAADWVISAADGHATIYDMLGGQYSDKRIDRAYETLETFPSYLQVSLGVARDLSHLPGFLTRLLDAPLAVDPKTQLRQISFRIFHFDPTFAPPGKTAVTCFLPTRDFGYWTGLQSEEHGRYQAEKRRIADAVIAVLERRDPGLRDVVETVDVSTPATVIRYTGNWKGSMEGWLLTPESGFNALPSMLPGLRRFVMAGQWVQPGGGLPTGLMTARAAVQSMCKTDHAPFLAAAPRQVFEKAA